MTVVAGVDLGFGRTRKSTGLCRTGDVRFLVTRAASDCDTSLPALVLPQRCDVLAVDGPVVSSRFPDNAARSVERLFSIGAFQKRCKAGVTHAAGSGRDFRRTAARCIRQLLEHVATSRELQRFPHVVPGASIVETFPSAFVGVMIDEKSHLARPAMDRGAKFSWLLDKWRQGGHLATLRDQLDWPNDELWESFATCRDSEKGAALVCLLAAACVARNRYVAIGEMHGGYFFLPPWDLWAEWAKRGVAENRQRPEIGSALEIWINAYPRDRKTKLPA